MAFAQQLYVAKIPGYTGYALPEEKGVQFSKTLGCTFWENEDAVIEYNIRFLEPGDVALHLMASNSGEETSVIAVRFANETKEIDIKPTGGDEKFDLFHAGSYNIPYPGFYTIRILPVKKSGQFFPGIKSIHVASSMADKIEFPTDTNRSAARVNLVYRPLPKNVSGFFVETRVPRNYDFTGTEITAIGNELMEVGQGNNKKGKYLYVKWKNISGKPCAKFIQSQFQNCKVDTATDKYTKVIIPYNWGVDNELPLTLNIRKDSCNNELCYDAKVYNSKKNQWYLLSEVRIRDGAVAVNDWFSAISNVDETTGYLERKVFFSNPVAITKNENAELCKATFGYGTRGKYLRTDYGAGVLQNDFWLSTGGFSHTKASYGEVLQSMPDDDTADGLLVRLKEGK